MPRPGEALGPSLAPSSGVVLFRCMLAWLRKTTVLSLLVTLVEIGVELSDTLKTIDEVAHDIRENGDSSEQYEGAEETLDVAS